MAVTTEDIQNYLAANPGMSDAQIVSAMQQYGVSPAQMSAATGVPLSEVTSRYEAITGGTTGTTTGTTTTGGGGVNVGNTTTTGGGAVTTGGATTTGAGTTGGATTVVGGGVSMFSDQDVRDYLNTALAGASDRDIASEMARRGVTMDQIARATNIPIADVVRRFGTATTPFTTPQFSDADVLAYLQARPGYTDAEIAADMIKYGVSPEQISRVTGLPLSEVTRRYTAVVSPLQPVTPITPVTPVTPITPVIPTTPTPPTTSGPSSIVPTPAISPAPGTVPAIGAALPGLPTQPTQYITPSGGTTTPPAGVTPFALPMLNMRNMVNAGVVPSMVAAPRSTSEFEFNPIERTGSSIF